jgi:Protein of unknown function (DUF3363)
VPKDFIANLERAEVSRVGKAMAAERGLIFTTAKTGEYVSGTLAGSTQLASGRFAMIDDGIGFQLVATRVRSVCTEASKSRKKRRVMA